MYKRGYGMIQKFIFITFCITSCVLFGADLVPAQCEVFIQNTLPIDVSVKQAGQGVGLLLERYAAVPVGVLSNLQSLELSDAVDGESIFRNSNQSVFEQINNEIKKFRPTDTNEKILCILSEKTSDISQTVVDVQTQLVAYSVIEQIQKDYEALKKTPLIWVWNNTDSSKSAYAYISGRKLLYNLPPGEVTLIEYATKLDNLMVFGATIDLDVIQKQPLDLLITLQNGEDNSVKISQNLQDREEIKKGYKALYKSFVEIERHTKSCIKVLGNYFPHLVSYLRKKIKII